MSRIAVLGAGSWGTTLADLLGRKGNEVRLWAFEPEVAASVNRSRENSLFPASRCTSGCAPTPTRERPSRA